jgi:hypothetical protein
MGLDKIPIAAGASLKRPNGDIVVSSRHFSAIDGWLGRLVGASKVVNKKVLTIPFQGLF